MNVNKVNLFVVGAAKSGTTSLYNYLDQHKDIFMSPIKEPHYFSKDIKFENYREAYKRKMKLNFDGYFEKYPLEKIHAAKVEDQTYYNRLFLTDRDYKIFGETSVSYLYSEVAAKEIYDYNSEAKIVIVLRDPVERVLSHYKMDFTNGTQIESNVLKGLKSDYESNNNGWGVSNLYLELSMYYNQVKRYYDVFDKDQIFIISFDDFKNKTSEIYSQLIKFLGLINDNKVNLNETHNKTFYVKNKALKSIIKSIRKFIPTKFKNAIKDNAAFKNKIELETEGVEEFLNSKLAKNWKLTKQLISENK